MVYVGPHSLPPSTGSQIQQVSSGRDSASPEDLCTEAPFPLPGSTLGYHRASLSGTLSCHPIGNRKRVGTCAPLVLTPGANFPSPVYDSDVLTVEHRKALLLVLKFKSISGYSSIENNTNAHISISPWYLDTHLRCSTIICRNYQCLLVLSKER